MSDCGVGMSPQQVEALFSFNEVKSQVGTNDEKGTGLGLNLCRTIIYKLKGDISVKSELGVGTSFYISIPTPSIYKPNTLLEMEELIN